jgi:hypothetical protein
MAINIGQIGDAITAGIEASYPPYFDTVKGVKGDHSLRMQVTVKYNETPGGPALVEVVDTKTGKEESFTLQLPFLSNKIIDAIERRDTKAIRALKGMKSGDEFQELILEEWKNGRSLFQDVPNKAAMLLLCGLNRGVPAPLMATKGGTTYRGGQLMRSLLEASLMNVINNGAKRPKYETSLRGYEVLQAWALRNKVFAKYLAAFCPDGWEDRTKAQTVLRAMHSPHSGANELLTHSASVGFITPAMRKLGII